MNTYLKSNFVRTEDKVATYDIYILLKVMNLIDNLTIMLNNCFNLIFASAS